MPSFLEDYSAFYGTGKENEQGLDLPDFLEQYHPGDYENPSVTTDIIVLKHEGTITNPENDFKVLMVKRRNHPCIGNWALPGGFVNIREDVLVAAKRELEEETHLSNIPMEQLRTWGEEWRDPRYRVITVAYLAVVDETVAKIKADDDALDAAWLNLKVSHVKREELEKNGLERIKNRYKVYLYNTEKQVNLTAYVDVEENKNSIIRETDYFVVENNGIAFDHARFLVQAVLYLKKRIKDLDLD